MLNLFVSGEAVPAGDALAAAADGGALARGAGIDHFIVLTTAFGATHNSTANCGSQICNILIVGASRAHVTEWIVRGLRGLKQVKSPKFVKYRINYNVI